MGSVIPLCFVHLCSQRVFQQHHKGQFGRSTVREDGWEIVAPVNVTGTKGGVRTVSRGLEEREQTSEGSWWKTTWEVPIGLAERKGSLGHHEASGGGTREV